MTIKLYKFVFATLLASVAACGGGGGSSSGPSSPPAPTPPPSGSTDTTRPTVVLSTGTTSLGFEAFDIDIAFSETVNDLTLSDFAVTGATLSNLRETASGAFAMSATATGGNMIVNLAADRVVDAAGNGNVASNMLIVEDLTPPEATVTFPTKRSMTEGADVLVRGRANDLSDIVALHVNGVAVSSTNGFKDWEVRVPLASGRNDLVVETEDAVGNFDGFAAQVRVDRSGPILQGMTDIDIDGDIAYVTDYFLDALVEVNLSTRAQTVISDNSDAYEGPKFFNPEALAIDRANNRVLIVDQTANLLMAVDRDTGHRSARSTT